MLWVTRERQGTSGHMPACSQEVSVVREREDASGHMAVCSQELWVVRRRQGTSGHVPVCSQELWVVRGREGASGHMPVCSKNCGWWAGSKKPHGTMWRQFTGAKCNSGLGAFRTDGHLFTRTVGTPRL